MQYVMWYVQDIMYSVQYDKYDDACYTHGITFQIKIWKISLTFLIQILKAH